MVVRVGLFSGAALVVVVLGLLLLGLGVLSNRGPCSLDRHALLLGEKRFTEIVYIKLTETLTIIFSLVLLL